MKNKQRVESLDFEDFYIKPISVQEFKIKAKVKSIKKGELKL